MRKQLLAAVLVAPLTACGAGSGLDELLKEAQGNNVVQAIVDAGGKVSAVSNDVGENFGKLIDDKYCKLPESGRKIIRAWLWGFMKSRVAIACPGEEILLKAEP